MRKPRPCTLFLACLLATGQAGADPAPGETAYLGPFTGDDAPLHPDNQQPKIDYYGTDLGWSYEHKGQIHFLFGDTFADTGARSIAPQGEPWNDDIFGTIDLAEWPDPGAISSDNLPRIRLGQAPASSRLLGIDAGHVMDLLKTPEAGFSSGEHEFAILLLSKPMGCATDAPCGDGLKCEASLGYMGPPYTDENGLTRMCMDGAANCIDNTMVDDSGNPVRDSGFCIDTTSTVHTDTPAGRIAAWALRQRIAIRDKSAPQKYHAVRDWLTNKFLNTTVRTVQDFIPGRGAGYRNQDYRPARDSGADRGLFLWGRPSFVGVRATGRSAGVYLAWVELPTGPDSPWDLKYFTGLDGDGVAAFSTAESEAVALDLDVGTAGHQPEEIHDIVQHHSVVWIDHLKKWVMFYGGGITRSRGNDRTLSDCGFMEVFVGPDCTQVDMGNGAIRMRTADDPWGPWSPPKDVLIGGDAAMLPPEHQFGPGGILRHPACEGATCAAHTPFPEFRADEYGWLYGVNIIEQWITPAGRGVDVIWNVSTWDPYRVVLLRTRINP